MVSAVDKVSKTYPKTPGNHNNGLTDLGRPVDYETNAHDLDILEKKLVAGLDERYAEKLHGITQRLIDVSRTEKQSINHSAMLLVASKHLIVKEKYDVKVEHDLGEGLVCDIYAKPRGRPDAKIVEIETGFAGPAYALDPNDYLRVRTASKIYRYSPHSTEFFLGTPPPNILYIPKIFLKPRESRTAKEIRLWNNLCDRYYKEPRLNFKDTTGHIEGIYVINVDSGEVQQMGVNDYMEKYPLMSRFPS